jgi:hypothetical protein
MKKIMCNRHKKEFVIPTRDEEFISGKWHKEVVNIQAHSVEFPDCKFREYQENSQKSVKNGKKIH